MGKQPNEKGLYDMTGNVSEWCWDTPIDATRRTCIGGGWESYASGCEFASTSNAMLLPCWDRTIGFRIVRKAD